MLKAGFLTRFFAWLIDVIIMSILATAFAACGVFVFVGLSGSESDLMIIISIIVPLLVMVIIFAFQFFYFGYYWSKDGQSLGMKMLKIKVIRRDNQGEINFWRAALRGTLGYYISSLVFSLGFIWAAFDSNSETWHDKIFDTWVVEIPD